VDGANDKLMPISEGWHFDSRLKPQFM